MSKGSGLSKQQELSDDLADFMGKNTATRAQVTKALWAYIKKHDLQHPTKRRIIEPDDVLAPLIGSKPIDMFKMTSKINEHFV